MATFGQPLTRGMAPLLVLPESSIVRVRFVQRHNGRIEPVAMYIESASDNVSLTGETIRSLPFGNMESVGNRHSSAPRAD